ncbi:MAG TPA: hypothetical protein VMV06_10260 [Acidimicrobiales bacterium]|nr:hypothetical protein [Acidimicrobiales bacterium]
MLPISLIAAAFMIVPLGLVAATGAASAATPGPVTCTGPLAAGTYSSVTVSGTCQISAGQVVVTGDVTIPAGSNSVLAAYALNGGVASTTSGLTVDGNVNIASGGTLILGCKAADGACFDDPAPTTPTLNSSSTIQGSINATSPLGVVVTNSTIGGDATQAGGGGGVAGEGPGCFAPPYPGVFNTFPGGGSPVYSDYEDNTIGGNLRITGLNSCWLGSFRNHIGGSATFSGNKLGDPDGSEFLTNQIAGNLLCSGNSPAAQYGDAQGTPNTVGGFATGECAFGVMVPNPAPSPGPPPVPAGPLTPISKPGTPPGYWLAAKDGGVFSFNVPFLGSQGGQSLSQPIVGMGTVPGGSNYNLADANGAVYGHGPLAADCAGLNATLNKPIVGIAPVPGGNGCWTAASDGGVFTFGSNAAFYGSAGAIHLNQPVVGIASTPNGDGYYLAASDGGVFTYGPGAKFYGSMGGVTLNKPVVGMAVDPATGGYWLVASDGGVFSFNAPFFGSTGSLKLNQPVVGMAAAPTGDGYYLVAADGGIFTFGTGAHFQGSTGAIRLNQPVVGMALG